MVIGLGMRGGGKDPKPLEIVKPDEYQVAETDDMNTSNTDGLIEIDPASEGDILSIGDDDVEPYVIDKLYTLGATDEQNTQYALFIDGEIVVGWKNSPFGLLNNQFSFVDRLGGPIDVDSVVKYKARVSPEADSSRTFAARANFKGYEKEDWGGSVPDPM